MYRIIYCSRAVRPMTWGELDDLMSGARKRNAERGITGLALYDGGAFVQVLEGEQAVVEALYERIVRDPRHCAVERVAAGPVAKRDFEDWAMGFENLAVFDRFDVSEFRARLAGTDPLDGRATYAVLTRFLDR